MIQEKIEGILNAAVARYAKELGVPESDIQIQCLLVPNGAGTNFNVLKQWKEPRAITVLELLNKKMDFTGMSGAIEVFIQKKLASICEQKQIDPASISGMIVKAGEEFKFHIYNGRKFVETITIEEILGQKI